MRRHRPYRLRATVRARPAIRHDVGVTSPRTGLYAPPRNPPPPRPRASRGVRALVVGGIVMVILVGALGATLLLMLGRSVVQSAFGTCEHTPAVAAVVEADLGERGYTVPSLEYDCFRDPAAQVTGDTAVLGVVPPGRFGSADEVVAAVSADLTGAGWSARPDDDEGRSVLGRDGYGLIVAVHSSRPALALLTLRRDAVGGETPWDGRDGSAQARELSEGDVRRYALLPDLTPTWAPTRFGDWSTRYRMDDTRYRGTTGEAEDRTYLTVDVVAASPDDPTGTCAAPGVCSVVGTAGNGLVVQEVLDPPQGADRPGVASLGVGAYVAQVDDVLVVLRGEQSVERGEYRGPSPRTSEVLDVDEALAVFASVDVHAVAPAR